MRLEEQLDPTRPVVGREGPAPRGGERARVVRVHRDRPVGHDASGPRRRPRGGQPGDPLDHLPRAVGDQHGVDRLDPVLERSVDVLDVAGEQQVAPGPHADPRTHPRGSPEPTCGPPGHGVEHDRPVRGLVRQGPVVDELLVVRHRVGDDPRDVTRVPEVGHAGHAGEGEAEHVDPVVLGDEMHLLVDARALEQPVRVGGEERCAGRAAGRRHRPGVAARQRRVPVRRGEDVGPAPAERALDVLSPQLVGIAAEEHVVDEEDADRRPRRPPSGLHAGGGHLGGARSTDLHAVVDAVDVGLQPGRDLRLLLDHPGPAPQRERVEPCPGGELVDGSAGLVTQPVGEPAGAAAPVGLDLPGPVVSARPALGVREVVETAPDAPGDAVLVALDPPPRARGDDLRHRRSG